MTPNRPKARQAGQQMLGDPERRRRLGAAFDQDQDLDQAFEYDRLRPRYPQQIVRLLMETATSQRTVPHIAEWGAGSGILTRELLSAGARVYAVEPSAVMIHVLTESAEGFPGELTVDRSPAESSTVPDEWADAVVAAQAWHWFDPAAAQAELGRVLRPGGAVMVVGNYLDTSVAWVHRLARIMRAGDVYRPDWAPDVGPGFSTPEQHHLTWTRSITPEDIRRLATTLSSWLSADEQDRQRRQRNLDWYLEVHLGFAPQVEVELPYRTVLHTARRT